jgi:glutamyl-tRNA reductase
MRKNSPVLKAVKQKLHDMHQCRMFLSTYHPSGAPNATLDSKVIINQYAIQKVIKNMALKMREQHRPGCSYIEAVHDFIITHRN